MSISVSISVRMSYYYYYFVTGGLEFRIISHCIAALGGGSMIRVRDCSASFYVGG